MSNFLCELIVTIAQFIMSLTLLVLRSSNVPLGPAQIESEYTYGRLEASIQKDSSFNPNSNALEPHRPQHDCPAVCVIVQQYSSTTFFLLYIHSP